MQRLLTILRLLLWLTMVVVGFALSRQLDALNRTLEHDRLRPEPALKEHQQFVDEHERRREAFRQILDKYQQVLDEHARRMERY